MTYKDVVVWIRILTVLSLVVEDYLMRALHPASKVIYTKFDIRMSLLRIDYYQKVIRNLQSERHYSYSQAL